MNEHKQAPAAAVARVRCYKCAEGCLHLEYGNVMLTFSEEQFLAFAEVVTTTRQRLLQEREAAQHLEHFAPAAALLM